MPPLQSQPESQAPAPSPLLSDVLQTLPSAQMFASLIRDVDSATDLLSTDLSPSASTSTSEGSSSSQQQSQQQDAKLIVLAPTNAALRALPQKPWRSSRDDEQFGAQAYDGEVGAERATSNLRHFVQRQIVRLSKEWREGERVKTVGGKQVWWVNQDGKKYLQPGSILVESEKQAGNGDIWLVEGVLGEG